MKKVPLALSIMLSDVTIYISPQIAQITQKKICENLQNLRLIDYNQLYVNL